jgi:hypothetical protein
MNPPDTAPQPNPAAAPAAPTPQTILPDIPDIWPGAWKLYPHSKQIVKRNWGPLLGIIAVSVALGNIPDIFLGKDAGNFVGFLLSLPLSIALVVAYLKAVRGQKVSFGESLKAGFDLMLCLKYLALSFVLAMALTVLFILLVVPFVIVLPRLVLAPFFLIDQKLGPIKALSASWDATKGHSGKIWGVIGALIAMGLLVLTIIGIPFALYFLFMYSASQVLLYAFIIRSQPAAVAAPTPVDPPAEPAGSDTPAPSAPQNPAA